MKKNDILKCLKANKNVSDYELTLTSKDSRELFYVLDHLEINRAVKTESQAIKVYVSNKKEVGTSTVAITAADDSKSLTKKIADAVRRAKSAKNVYYPLPKKSLNITEKALKEKDLNEIACNVAKAMLKADVYENGWINSTEIFVSSYTKEFVNSKGINHKTYSFNVEVECIPTWSNGKEEIELYKFIESNKIDYKKITEEVSEILNLAKERSIARKIKDVNIPNDVKILVKNDMLDTLVANISADLSYRSLYMKQNHYKLKDVISNTKFDLTMKPVVEGCASSRKYDGNGITLKAKKIISKGVAISNYGDIQFGHYLGVKDITGSLPIREIKAEGYDYSKEKHLIIETFSSPQLEENSGYWGGEVRLARYFDGQQYIPLTDFSISGSIYEDLKNVKFSKEQSVSSIYKGPKYFIFEGIKIH